MYNRRLQFFQILQTLDYCKLPFNINQKEQVNMAFVYRSPRKLDYDASNTTVCAQKDQYQEQDLNDSNINTKQIKKPIKGFTFERKQKAISKQKHYQLSKENQKATKIHERQKSKSISKNLNKQQYFFKSKNSHAQKQYQSRLVQPVQTLTPQILKSKSKQHDKHISETKQIKQKSQQEKKLKSNRVSQPLQNLKDSVKQFQQNKKSLPCLMRKQWKNNDSAVNLLHSKKKLNKIFGIPSIPGKLEKFGYVVDKNTELSYPKHVSKPRFQGQKSDYPGPTDYNICPSKKIKGVLKFNSAKNQYSASNESEFYALINDQQGLKKHNQKIKQWVQQVKQNKKAQKKQRCILVKKQREENQTRDISENSDDSGITVYEDDETPGPGYYNYSCLKDKKNFRSKNQKYSKIFISQSQRFQLFQKPISSSFSAYQSNQKDYLNENQYKSSKFFISKLKRQTKLQKLSDAPSPGHYNIRVSMQNDVISKILKNSPNLFNNKLPRLMDTVCSITPGPGYYNLNEPNFKVQSFPPQPKATQQKNCLIQKSNNQLKLTQKILIENVKQKLSPCKEKEKDKDKSCLNYQQVKIPFMSTSPKGLSYQNNSITNCHTSLPLKPMNIKNKQNIYAFNACQERVKEIKYPYNAQVGLYELSNWYDLEKKSFNVLFN